jgi:hypothetical protein
MEDMTEEDNTPAIGRIHVTREGYTYKGDGENWVLQDPGIVEDTARGVAAGLGTGTHKALTFLGNAGEMLGAGAQALAGKDSPLGGDIQHLRDEYTYPASTEGSKWLVDKAFPFTTYEPQHTLGNIGKTGADILPSAALGVLGEGAFGAAYGPAAVRAGLSTAGGALGGGLTHDNLPLLEGPAEAAGMMAGMGGPAMVRGLLKPKKGGVVEAAKNFGGNVIEHGFPPLAAGAAGAYLGSKFGHNPLASAMEAGVLGYLGGTPIMKAGGELASAAGKAMVPKAVPQTISAMTKALSKKTPYNTQGLDTASAVALLAGQGAPAVQTMIGPP